MTAQLTDQQRARLLARQHKLRLQSDLTYFAEHAIRIENDANRLSACHRLLLSKLQAVAEGKIKKLMVFMPSGSGKSTILSRIFPAWYMAMRPGAQVIGASHNGEFAENKVSRPVQDILKNFKDELEAYPIDDNKKEWRTNNGSSYRAAGAGAGILGERASLGIIDDPFGQVADAKSATIRDKVYDWYRGDFTSRLHIGRSQQILMHQRVHMDDLAGRLLAEEGDTWEVLHLPARFEGLNWRGQPIAIDELGRTEIGQSIWPENWTDEELETREAAVGPYAWASMYQQRPQPVGGALFKPSKLVRIEPDEVEPAARIVRAWDYAASGGRGDFTVGALMQENGGITGGHTVLDLVRGQVGPDDMFKMIVETAAKDAARYGVGKVKIILPQDPAAAGVHLVNALTKALAGYWVEAVRESGDKETRATPFASQVGAGNVSMVYGPWNKALLNEMESFPGSKYDDQIDALSTAFAHLIPVPVRQVTPSWGRYNIGR